MCWASWVSPAASAAARSLIISDSEAILRPECGGVAGRLPLGPGRLAGLLQCFKLLPVHGDLGWPRASGLQHADPLLRCLEHVPAPVLKLLVPSGGQRSRQELGLA